MAATLSLEDVPSPTMPLSAGSAFCSSLVALHVPSSSLPAAVCYVVDDNQREDNSVICEGEYNGGRYSGHSLWADDEGKNRDSSALATSLLEVVPFAANEEWEVCARVCPSSALRRPNDRSLAYARLSCCLIGGFWSSRHLHHTKALATRVQPLLLILL